MGRVVAGVDAGETTVDALMIHGLNIAFHSLPHPDRTNGWAMGVTTLVYTTAYTATFLSNHEAADMDEGFLHPALMSGLAFLGLLEVSRPLTPLQTGLFNPAVTLVLWLTLRAPVLDVFFSTVSDWSVREE